MEPAKDSGTFGPQPSSTAAVSPPPLPFLFLSSRARSLHPAIPAKLLGQWPRAPGSQQLMGAGFLADASQSGRQGRARAANKKY